MHENELAKTVVDAAFKVHTTLGPSLLESAYQKALAYELAKRGLQIQIEAPIHIEYDGQQLGEGFRADIVVENKIIIELKSVSSINAAHKKQLLTYLRLSNLKLGLLINFGVPLIKNGISRIVNGLEE